MASRIVLSGLAVTSGPVASGAAADAIIDLSGPTSGSKWFLEHWAVNNVNINFAKSPDSVVPPDTPQCVLIYTSTGDGLGPQNNNWSGRLLDGSDGFRVVTGGQLARPAEIDPPDKLSIRIWLRNDAPSSQTNLRAHYTLQVIQQ